MLRPFSFWLGRSSAALRDPAPLTVLPLRPVVAFADVRLTLWQVLPLEADSLLPNPLMHRPQRPEVHYRQKSPDDQHRRPDVQHGATPANSRRFFPPPEQFNRDGKEFEQRDS